MSALVEMGLAQRGKRPGSPHRLPEQVYERMWSAFLVTPTIAGVVERVGVSRTAARRYVNTGDPSRGLRPLRVRYTEFQRALEIRRAAAEHHNLSGGVDAMYDALLDGKGALRPGIRPSPKDFIQLAKLELAYLRLELGLPEKEPSERRRRPTRTEPSPVKAERPRPEAAASERDLAALVKLLDDLAAETTIGALLGEDGS